ncbi:glutamate receptor [Salix suchowensis]|nr:glutamate receptor [Salix suchowensis]
MKRTGRVLKPCILLSVLITFLPIFSNGVEAAIGTNNATNIGAIIDVNSRIGKEEKTALEMAVQNFNLISTNHELSLHLRHPGEDPLQVAHAAEELIKEKKVKVIIGMDKWEEAALVANIGNQYQIPILSFATPAITPPLTTLRWPFLIRMTSDGSEQMRCIADLVGCYNWRKVVVIYEDNVYGGESGNLALLSEELQEVGAEIEYHLVLPPSSLSTDLKHVVYHELIKLQKDTESRVFIVLQSSLPMLTYLFREAKNMGLVGRDTAWILSNSITSILDSMNNSVISSMEGALGIQTYYSSSSSYQSFEAQFRKIFRAEYLDEDNFLPGIQALRAYDSIGMVTQAIEKFGSDSISPKMLLNSVLGSNFTGLTGEIHFKDGMRSDAPILRIVNVVGKKYKELDFWSPNLGFSKTLYAEDGKERCSNSSVCNITGCLSGPVIWPGDLNDRDPKGWALPTNARPLRIVVPKRTSFDKFVTFKTGEALPEGFCIDIFNEVVERLNYSLPHDFFEHDGLYDEMIEGVYNKTYDAAIGDITILAERTKYVEFTQPYAESGLSMIVPFANKDSAWIFMKPFSWETWIVSGAIFIYTLLIVWFMEHQSNPYFRGPLKVQIENALWLLSCSLFFIHAEKLYSNLTRIVVVMWLFVVFICTASYTANLTSMLTVQRMEEPNFSEYKSFQTKHLTVGCDNDSFVQNYLKSVLGFEKDHIKIIGHENDYPTEFEKKTIAAAFLELPYEKVFLDKYCKRYTGTKGEHRFGGFGFAFQKGSPIASDFSRAILLLSEKGTLKTLEERWFAPSPECSPTATNNNVERLSLGSFKGIYIISASISTICFLLVLIPLVRNSRNHQEANEGNVTPSGNSGASKGGEVSKPFYNGDKTRIPRRASTFAQALDTDRWGSSRWERVSNSDNLENHHEDSSQAEIEMA